MKRVVVVIVCLLWSFAPVSRADDSAVVLRPKRLVHLFDFEERRLGNYEDLPMHWYVVGRPAMTSDPNFGRHPLHRALVARTGFPAYTTVAFDRRHAYSGQFSFHLGLNGGNAGAFLEVGTLPAVPKSDYLVSAVVRTDGLERASARVIGYYLTADGQVIDASRAVSEPVAGTRDWTTVSLKLPGEYHDAAWVGLELEVAQPTPSPDHPLRKQQVVLQEVRGDAWFDDISVWQLPHVDLASQSEVGIVRAPDRPVFDADVRDLTGRRLRAEIIAYDHHRREVDRMERPVGAGAPMNWRWTPRLPAHGWYLLDLKVHEDATDREMPGPVARTLAAVLWLPPATPLPPGDRVRFGVSAQGVSDAELTLLPELLRASDLHHLVLSAWSRETTVATLDARQERIDAVLRQLFLNNRSAALSLWPLPDALAETPGVETTRPLAMFEGDRGAWLPYLAPMLMRQGQRVRQWQLGRAGDSEAFFERGMPSQLAGIEREIRAMAPDPHLLLPWDVHHSRRPDLPSSTGVALHVPVSLPAESLPEQLAEWRSHGQPLALTLDTLPAERVDHEARAADLTLRMLYGWVSGADSLTLTRPWTTAIEDRTALWPDAMLGVLTNVARHLAGRRLIGVLPLREGLYAMVLDGEAGPLLVAWATSAEPSHRELSLYLGDSPVAHDPWGNATPVRLVGGEHVFRVDSTPTFITGIDAELALFRAAFRVEQPFVESRQTPHDRTVVLRNPWSRTINGSLLFTGPKGWSVQPPRHSFSLSPGQELRVPVQLTFPFSELAGAKDFTARAEFAADRPYSVSLATPIELGLTDLEFDANVALRPSPSSPAHADAEVICIITNNGRETRSLSLFAMLPTQARQDRVISNLQPGQSIVRRFRFSGLTPADRQHALRTGVRELTGPAVLNRLLPLDGTP